MLNHMVTRILQNVDNLETNGVLRVGIFRTTDPSPMPRLRCLFAVRETTRDLNPVLHRTHIGHQSPGLDQLKWRKALQ